VALAILAALAGACAPRKAPSAPEPAPGAGGWVSPLQRDHPLVGKIWSPRAGAFVGEAEVLAAVTGAHHVLLGETHDNADHHLLQARLVRAAAERRRPAIAFEMLDTPQQPDVDAAVAQARPTARGFAEAVRWSESGWPPFGLYQPLFEEALAARLPIVAANLPRRTSREVFTKGASALPEPVRERMGRVGTFPEDVTRALQRQMAQAHCGELPNAMVEPMVMIQKAKDAQLAERMESADRGDGTILVAGSGHVRNDVGVPVFLRPPAGRGVLAVAAFEVSASATSPEDYRSEFGDGPLPFDYVFFTPSAEREDQCEKLRAREHAWKEKAAAGASAPPDATPVER
jgi:uncharacterized iron-regulated protein